MDMLLAIDPGNVQSAYVVIDPETWEIYDKGKVDNAVLLICAKTWDYSVMAVEMIASYGMPVGESVFETVVMIGRLVQIAEDRGYVATRVKRIDIKNHICHSSRAKDSNIRRALIDRFAQHDKNRGTGTKNNPDYFYGFKSDIWAAMAVAVYYTDNRNTLVT